MKEIKLTRGKIALVDDEDYEYLNQWKWQAQTNRGIVYYAGRTINRAKGLTRKLIMMHSLIMNTPEGMQVDHINHNGLDNRKENLRVVTQSENQHNRRKINNNKSSQYKGVSYHKTWKKFQARITNNSQLILIGYFHTPEDAAHAYDKKAKELFGEFAFLNFPEEV